MNRRSFIKGAIALSACSTLMPWLSACSVSVKTVFASAFTDKANRHYVGWFDQQGHLHGRVEISERAHDLAYIKSQNRIIAFARRPGVKLHVIDVASKLVVQEINAQPQHHFFGHGVLNADESLLFTTENYFDEHMTERDGLITVRDTKGFSIVGQFSSHGVGPHQLAMLSDNQTLVIANGGIHTHPAKSREKLNLDTMQPNLSYINTFNGELVAKHQLRDKHLSIRHLCVANDDTVYFGCQYQGAVYQVNPLIYGHRIGEQIQPMQATDNEWMRFKQYIASLSVNDQNALAVTSPRGGVVSIWDRSTRELKSLLTLDDTAGIASSKTTFIATTGRGNLVGVDKALNAINQHQIRWDNHLISFMA